MVLRGSRMLQGALLRDAASPCVAAGRGNSPELLLPEPAPAAALCARLISAINSECSNCRHLVGDFMIIVFCHNCAEHLGVSLLKEIKP